MYYHSWNKKWHQQWVNKHNNTYNTSLIAKQHKHNNNSYSNSWSRLCSPTIFARSDSCDGGCYFVTFHTSNLHIPVYLFHYLGIFTRIECHLTVHYSHQLVVCDSNCSFIGIKWEHIIIFRNRNYFIVEWVRLEHALKYSECGHLLLQSQDQKIQNSSVSISYSRYETSGWITLFWVMWSEYAEKFERVKVYEWFLQ